MLNFKTFKNFLENLLFLKQFFANYTNKIYIVGGSLRDTILNKEISDFDIEVFGVDEQTFINLMQELKSVGVGKSFFVYKWRNIDISLPRVEKKVGFGHRAFEVSLAKDEKIASKRRDFTMNALMYNLYTNELLDFWGGVNDIEQKIIKIIDEEKFKEDSLRVFRAMQFSARFKFKIEKNSLKIMQNINLNDLSSERVFFEFEKMFSSKYLYYGFYYFFKLKIAKKLLNLEIDFKTFLKTAKELKKYQKNFNHQNYKYYFLYILSKNLYINYPKIASILKFPNSYIKILSIQKSIPKKFNDKFLLALSLKYPLKNWLGNYKFIDKIKSLNIYENSFETNITSAEVLKDGFKNKEIAKEIKRRKLLKITNF